MVIHKQVGGLTNVAQCGAGFRAGNIVADTAKVTCKSCLRWQAYYDAKAAKNNPVTPREGG